MTALFNPQCSIKGELENVSTISGLWCWLSCEGQFCLAGPQTNRAECVPDVPLALNPIVYTLSVWLCTSRWLILAFHLASTTRAFKVQKWIILYQHLHQSYLTILTAGNLRALRTTSVDILWSLQFLAHYKLTDDHFHASSANAISLKDKRTE